MAEKKPSLFDLYKMKQAGEKISWLTSYDFPTAQFAEALQRAMNLTAQALVKSGTAVVAARNLHK